MTSVTYVGTGSAFTRRFGHCNALVESGDARMMIDLGHQTPARLDEMKIGLRAITHVAVSHLHADHIGGLEELAFMSYFVFGSRPCLLIPEPLLEPLWKRCLSGGLGWVSDDSGRPLRREITDYFDVVTLRGGIWQTVGGVEIQPFRVDHVPGTAAYGFFLRDAATGARCTITGDVRAKLPQLLQEELPEDFRKGPIFHDCQLFDGGPGAIHVALDRILEYPAAIRSRLVLTHYGDSVEEYLSKIAAAGLRVVWPGQRIDLGSWLESLQEVRATGS